MMKYNLLTFLFVILFLVSISAPSSNSQEISILSTCVTSPTPACLVNPTDITISSDGSFILIADSTTNSYIRKVNFTDDDFNNDELFFLNENTVDNGTLRLILSQDKTKALAFNSNAALNPFVKIIDFKNNTTKILGKTALENKTINAASFLDPLGEKVAFCTNEKELIIIDSRNGKVLNNFALEDIAGTIITSPDFKKALIIYKDILLYSFSVFDIEKNKITTTDLSSELIFKLGEFAQRVSFDLSGSRATISSASGEHVFYLIDLDKGQLFVHLLDENLKGKSISKISPDGATAYVASNILDGEKEFKLYKLDISNPDKQETINSKLFEENSSVIDLDISPDQSKLILLTSDGKQKKLKVLNYNDLSQINEIMITSDDSDRQLLLEPFGRYAVTLNNNNENPISIIKDFDSGPIFKSISPDNAGLKGSTSFTINGFIDLKKFDKKVNVCFRNINYCASFIVLSNDGKTISGLTPKFPKVSKEDIIITAKSEDGTIQKSSVYKNVFEFLQTSTVEDKTPPFVIVTDPDDFSFHNTKALFLKGKANGTGSEIEKITVNGQEIKFTHLQGGHFSVRFAVKLNFQNDGTFQIKLNAKDRASNSSTVTRNITIDTTVPNITITSPENNITLNTKSFAISGKVDGTGSPPALLLINNKKIPLTITENTATFESNLELKKEGDNKITFKAFDEAGNGALLIQNVKIQTQTTSP